MNPDWYNKNKGKLVELSLHDFNEWLCVAYVHGREDERLGEFDGWLQKTLAEVLRRKK